MKKVCIFILLLIFLPMEAQAAEIPRELVRAMPEQAEHILKGAEFSGTDGLVAGVERILQSMSQQAASIFRQRVRGAAAVLLVVILCGMVDAFYVGVEGGKATPFLPMTGALSVTMLTAGSLDMLIGLGAETIRELSVFSKVLLPTLAAATAATGAITTATFQQVSTVFLADLLMNLIHGLLMPMVYLYIGVLTAAACLPENRLGAIAEGLKKVITWILTTALMLFTVYLSVARIISGGVDSSAVRITKSAISGAVPVVGGIIAEASETVLAGAGLLKNTIGIFGMLAILAACAYPFLQLGIQYLLYKLTAFLAAVTGAPSLCKLIDGLGGAFGLVLGMTGSCALLLLVSVLSSVAAVVP